MSPVHEIVNKSVKNNSIVEEKRMKLCSQPDLIDVDQSLLNDTEISNLADVITEEDYSDLTFTNYSSLTPSERCKLNNRVRQISHRLKGSLPKSHAMFVLVTAHLLRNAHTYFGLCKPSNLQKKILENCEITPECKEKIIQDFKDANKKVRSVRTLKYQNRLNEQIAEVEELKQMYGSYRNISKVSGVPVKSVYKWCSAPKDKLKRRIELSQLRKKEYEQFLLQDSISFAHPCKKYSDKRYLRHTLADTRTLYLSQPEYHKYGILGETRMKDFRPDYIMLARDTPLSQCLCQGCENCEKIIKALIGIGLKGIPGNRFAAINCVMCEQRIKQANTEFSFAPIECITGECEKCSVESLYESIKEQNLQMFQSNAAMTWQWWMPPPGKKVPDIVHVKGTVEQGVRYLVDSLKTLKGHVFRSNWNHNIFEYIKKHLKPGELAQIFDFSMNFRNIRQHEVQTAFWDCSQTSIHVIINIFPCPKNGCSGNIILTTCQITDDLCHDSFVTRAAHNVTFEYLANEHIPMDTVYQFSDNCGSQYKSRRPFVELARSPLNIVRVYFGERHGKNMCDGFFGRLKAWMTYKIKTKNAQITNAYDFFVYCRDNYKSATPAGVCDHNPVKFQYLTPQDIRRHQDIDLQRSIPGTRSIFSVKNTDDPLVLKFRNVACLCPSCVYETGERCLNYQHTDAWRPVTLEPKTSIKKRPDPRQISNNHSVANDEEEEANENIAEINTEDESDEDDLVESKSCSQLIDLNKNSNVIDKKSGEIFINLTVKKNQKFKIWVDEEDDRLLTANEPEKLEDERAWGFGIDCELPTFDGIADDIPEDILWESFLSALESCSSFTSLESMAVGISTRLPSLLPRKSVPFKVETELIDARATASIPSDAPKNVDAIKTTPDGNCFCRAVSRAMWGDEGRHLEVRTRIIVEGVVNKKKYLNHTFLAIGTDNASDDLPQKFAQYSDFYRSGQRMTPNTIDYMYSREIHQATKVTTYMGLWQFAQASSALGVPFLSIYPEGGDKIM